MAIKDSASLRYYYINFLIIPRISSPILRKYNNKFNNLALSQKSLETSFYYRLGRNEHPSIILVNPIWEYIAFNPTNLTIILKNPKNLLYIS